MVEDEVEFEPVDCRVVYDPGREHIEAALNVDLSW
jgi:hypothetical protein